MQTPSASILFCHIFLFITSAPSNKIPLRSADFRFLIVFAFSSSLGRFDFFSPHSFSSNYIRSGYRWCAVASKQAAESVNFFFFEFEKDFAKTFS